jgi:D-amino peptidase
MKVYIMTDIEGVCGIVDFDRQCLPHSPGFPKAQLQLTAEVNAAVEGAREAGAATVLVCDAHYQGHNILHEQLVTGAELLQGRMRPHWLPCIEEGWDAFVQVGVHAMAGTPEAVLCHSMELDIVSIRLNGQLIGEIGMAAAAAGSLGIPNVLVTGDSAAVAEMQALVPQCEGVAVKRGLSRGLARHLAPADACAAIRAGMRRALQRRIDIPPYRLSPPYVLEVTYVAPQAEYLRKKTDLQTRALSPTTIEYRGGDLVELFKIFE